MLFSNLELHLTTTRSSTFSGFKLALMGVTTLPATEKTRSNLYEVAGTGKTLLTSLARRGTGSRDASPIPAGPLWTAHQATVGKTSFFTPWGTLNFFSSSYSSIFTISLLFCACKWFLKALVEPWQTLMTKAEPVMMNIYLLTSDDLWASPLVGLYMHRRHFAMAPSRLSPKYLQTLDACFFGTTLLF